MALNEYQVYPEVDNLMTEIRSFGLFEHIVELEAYGITVVPPDKMQCSPSFIDRLRTAIIKACESRNNVKLVTLKPQHRLQTRPLPIAGIYSRRTRFLLKLLSIRSYSYSSDGFWDKVPFFGTDLDHQSGG